MRMGIRASGAVRNLLRTSRSLSGRADRYNSGFFIKHQKELTTLPVLRYSSGHRKGRLKILNQQEPAIEQCALRYLGGPSYVLERPVSASLIALVPYTLFALLYPQSSIWQESIYP